MQTAATAHYAAAVIDFVASETRIGQGALIEEMGEEPPKVVGGTLCVPDGPGLGVMLREEVLRANLAEGEPWWC